MSGAHQVKVVVSDGKTNATALFDLTVEAAVGGAPSSGERKEGLVLPLWVGALALVCGVVAVGLSLRRRR